LREQRLAGSFATPTRFGANPAMFHFCGVLFAFRTAALACLDTGAKLRACQFEVGAGKARDDPRRRQTYISAISAIADAADHLRDVLFGEAGIGARVTGLCARIACGNAFD